jgi:cystathionine beta-lyase
LNNYNFDQIIDRRNTNCAKWDTLAKIHHRNDLIHLGVADMDFKSPQAILDAFSRVVDHGVFGYSDLNDAFYTSIQKWLKKKTALNIPREWIVFCPRINIAAGICVESFTKPGSKVILNSPAYSPLRNAITKNNRIVIENRLVLKDGRFQMDFDYLESIVDEDTELFLFVNPDNPSGRVWSKAEMEQLVDFCVRHNLFLFVDEIHSDLLAEGIKHNSVLSLSGEIKDRYIYAGSLTKTFNIPGVIVSYMVIPNEKLRAKVRNEIDRIGMHNPNIFSVVAVEAGYNDCEDWLRAVTDYINQNDKFFREYVKRHLPRFHIMPREGTYLLWIDYSSLGVAEDDLNDWFINKARVEVYMGSNFGKDGIGYIRVNLATSRLLLQQALERMKEAYPLLQNYPEQTKNEV